MLKGILLLLCIVIGGPLVGGGLFLSSKIIYLVLFSPLIFAAIGGVIFSNAVKVGKMRRAMPVFLAGMLMGAVAYGTFRYAEYLDFVRQSRNDLRAEAPDIDTETADAFIDLFLEDSVGETGFYGFTKLQADEGMTISPRRTSGSLGIGTTLTIIYWIIEIIIFVFGIALAGMAQTDEPYCEEEDDWLRFANKGQVRHDRMTEFLALIQSGQWQQAGALVSARVSSEPVLNVTMGRCGSPSAEGYLRMTVKNGKDTKKLDEIRLDATQYEQFESSIGVKV